MFDEDWATHLVGMDLRPLSAKWYQKSDDSPGSFKWALINITCAFPEGKLTDKFTGSLYSAS